MRKLVLLLVVVALSAGCQTPARRTWVPAEPTFEAPAAGYSVQLPAGWSRFAVPARPDDLVLSRDGVSLQRILVLSDEPGHRFFVGDSKRRITAEMSPQEAAEAVIDGLESAGWSALRIVENAPAALAGRKGFRLVGNYRAQDGLRVGIALYGVVIPGGVYYLMYQAPERVYFARHLPDFDALAASFQLRPDARGVRRRHADEGESPAREEGAGDTTRPDAPAPAPST